MHLIERTPCTYRHRGYEIEVVACGPFRWAVWRIGGDDCWHVRSLAEAREVIAEDIKDRREVGR